MMLTLAKLQQLVREQLMPPGYYIAGPVEGTYGVRLPDGVEWLADPDDLLKAAVFYNRRSAREAAWDHFDAQEDV